MDSKNEAQAVSDEPTADEQLIACLEDDAAKLKQENPDDEMAATMLEAADRIRALSAQPAVQVPQWISVEERTPDDGQYVLLMSESWLRPAVMIYQEKPWHRFMDQENGRWYWYPERMHWMPFTWPIPAANPSEGAGE